MDTKKLDELIETGENRYIDFKLKCEAFKSGGESAKAELAKDVCAMANNGNARSYIVIGVSDDRKGFTSVDNDKLTDDQVQDFCANAINPPPIVRLFRIKGDATRERLNGKTFAVLVIGPNARKAFHLGRDFIDYDRRYCYRKNEVWVRRGATSDVAAPEEVERLVRGREPIVESPSFNNRKYGHLERTRWFDVIWEDLKDTLEDSGAKLLQEAAITTIGNRPYIWQVLLASDLNEKLDFLHRFLAGWKYQHGVLAIATGSLTQTAFPKFMPLFAKERWGYFGLIDPTRYGWRPTYVVPSNRDQFLVGVVALKNVRDTATLREHYHLAMEFLRDHKDTLALFMNERSNLSRNLRRWLREGWYQSGRNVFHSRPKPERENQIVRRTPKGWILLNRIDDQDWRKAARSVITESRGV